MKKVQALWLAGCLLASACITTPLEQQSWLAIRTTHYDIWSSLGEEETTRLAISAERFRAAVAYLWGERIPPPPTRTRIFAFDDRGSGRIFAFGPERSYLLPRHDGDVIVLRTGGSWDGDARTELKLAYARHLIRSVASNELPPWIEEGMAQLASTVEIRGVGASLGIPRRDHIKSLREEQWVPFERLLGATELVGWTAWERQRFGEEAWALCHYLRSNEAYAGATPAQLADLRRWTRRGEDDRMATDLQRLVWKHVTDSELLSYSVRILDEPGPAPREVPLSEILEELAWLALVIDERRFAERYNAEAEEAAAEPSARVLATDAALRELEGDTDEADALYDTALELAPDDPLLQAARGDQLRKRAEQSADPAERRELAERAREHYRHAIYLRPRLPAAHAGIAATYLLEGEDPGEGREPVLVARGLLPGDAAIRELEARLLLANGSPKGARQEALRLVTWARSLEELRAARALLDEIAARTPDPGRPAASE